MSSKQLARTVVDGRKVTFTFPASTVAIEGYLCGMDDFHWFVVTPSGVKHLIHKAAPLVSLATDCTYQQEPHRDELEAVVAPFRSHVQATYFGRGQSEEPSE